MRTTANSGTGPAITAVVGVACILAWAASSGAQSLRPFQATDLGVIGDAGALNNEADNGLTASFDIRRFIQGVQRNIPSIATMDDSCRDRMDLDTQPGRALSINDSRIVVGAKGIEAMEWFPSQCANSVASGALPRLEPANFQGARANANNVTRDAVGATTLIVPSLSIFHDVPTVWRKVTGGFTVQQLQTTFRPSPFSNVRQPGAALDINDTGTIVGFTRVAAQLFNRAAIFHVNQDPEILQLTPAAADYLLRLNEARGISSNGYITGIASRYMGGGERQTRGYVRLPNGEVHSTRIPAIATYIGSEAHRVNSAGFAVGKLLRSDGGTQAALWNEEGQLVNLGSLYVGGLPAGTTLTEALDINDHGDLLVKGLVSGQLRAFVLRPGGAALVYWAAVKLY